MPLRKFAACPECKEMRPLEAVGESNGAVVYSFMPHYRAKKYQYSKAPIIRCEGSNRKADPPYLDRLTLW